MMEEWRIERVGAHLVHQHTHVVESEEPRGGFDMENDDEDREASDDDSDDDTRSMSTVVPHELERVEEEEDDQMAEEERRGRPRTLEPSRMGLDYSSLLSSVPRRAITPPLSQQMSWSVDVYDQMQKLSMQVTTVMALTTTLEAQHSAAQTTIQALENKVEALEGMLRIAEEALKEAKTVQEEEAKEIAHQVKEEEEKNEKETLTQMLGEWKKSVEGQWSLVQEAWKEERERFRKAREEWEPLVYKLSLSMTPMAADGNDATSSSSTSHLKNFVASVHLEDLLWRFLLIFFPSLQSQQHPSTTQLQHQQVPA
jgi:hypothetical protein